MLRAFSLAFAQLFTAPILAIIGVCTMLSIACFVGVWFGLDWAATSWFEGDEGSNGWLGWFSGFATLVLAYFLFPIVATAFVTLFLDRIAKTVEKQHYPHLPPAKGLPLMAGLGVTARFFVVLILANALLLGLLLFPPVYAVAWFVVNGGLLGREYFELVAMRRLSPADADSLRKRQGLPTFLTGLMLAVLLIVPLLALILPVLATAVMVHRFHELHGTELDR